MPVALVAAYLLLLQSVLGAFGTGPSASQLDAFGNVICTHDGAGQLPDSDQHPSHVPTCCMLGCNMLSSIHAPPPSAVLALANRSTEILAFVPAASPHLDFPREHSPSNPRAPPLMA